MNGLGYLDDLCSFVAFLQLHPILLRELEASCAIYLHGIYNGTICASDNLLIL